MDAVLSPRVTRRKSFSNSYEDESAIDKLKPFIDIGKLTDDVINSINDAIKKKFHAIASMPAIVKDDTIEDNDTETRLSNLNNNNVSVGNIPHEIQNQQLQSVAKENDKSSEINSDGNLKVQRSGAWLGLDSNDNIDVDEETKEDGNNTGMNGALSLKLLQ